jgi:hypothetical protein
MVASSRYWSIWCINPASEKLGYKTRLIASAQAFAQSYMPDSQDGAIQSALLSQILHLDI